MTQQNPSRSLSSGKMAALCALAGLLIGASALVPITVSWRNSAKQAQADALAQAKLADQRQQEAVALEKQKSEMRDNLGVAQKTITTMQDDLTARVTALDSLKQVDEEKTKAIETLRADVRKQSDAMTDLDSRLHAAQYEVENTTHTNAELSTKVNSLKGEASRLSETVSTQGAEIAHLVEVNKQQVVEIQTAQQQAEAARTHAMEAQAEAAEAQAKAAAAHQELMARAPLRIEERHSTKTGKKVAEKSGVPFGAAVDPLGDIFTGIGEGLFGKSGPVILVAVFKDGHEETMTSEDAAKWSERGIKIVRLPGSKNLVANKSSAK